MPHRVLTAPGVTDPPRCNTTPGKHTERDRAALVVLRQEVR